MLLKSNDDEKCIGPTNFESKIEFFCPSLPLEVGCVGSAVERWSLTGELSLSCARPAADVGKLSAIGQPTRQLSLSSFLSR